jgi:flavoprotein
MRHNEYHYKGNDIFKFKNLSIAQNYTKKTKLVKTVNRFYYLFNKIKENVNQDYRNIVDELNKQIDEL